MSATRAETVAASLRSAILRGDYLPGERLVELPIADSLGVSQATVRDALRLLERDGWVVSQPRRGVTVRAFTREEAEEVFVLTAAVEAQALRWALPSMNRSIREALRGHVRAARRASQDDKPAAVLSILFEIHFAIARVAGSERPLTAALLSQLHNHMQLLEAMRRTRTRLPVRELHPLIEGHDVLCDRIDARDAEGAEAALRRQIALLGGLVMEALRG